MSILKEAEEQLLIKAIIVSVCSTQSMKPEY